MKLRDIFSFIRPRASGGEQHLTQDGKPITLEEYIALLEKEIERLNHDYNAKLNTINDLIRELRAGQAPDDKDSHKQE